MTQEHQPDSVLPDAMMPRLDGYGLCPALKEDARTSHIPVVVLTAQADRLSKLQGLNPGASPSRSTATSCWPSCATSCAAASSCRRLTGVASAPSMMRRWTWKLCAALALSHTQLRRKLKTLTGQAPGDFICSVRRNRAHALLVGGVATVAGFPRPSASAWRMASRYQGRPAPFSWS